MSRAEAVADTTTLTLSPAAGAVAAARHQLARGEISHGEFDQIVKMNRHIAEAERSAVIGLGCAVDGCGRRPVTRPWKIEPGTGRRVDRRGVCEDHAVKFCHNTKDDPRRNWRCDDAYDGCQICGSPFAGFFGPSRHHCRICGRLVCGQHAAFRARLPKLLGHQNAVRVCDLCRPNSNLLRPGAKAAATAGEPRRQRKRSSVEEDQADRIATLEGELRRKGHEVLTLQESWRIEPCELTLEAFIAQGGEGRVHRGRWRNLPVVIKSIKRNPSKPEEHGFSNAEVYAMVRLRGRRLVHFYGVGQCTLEEGDKDEDEEEDGLPVLRSVTQNSSSDQNEATWDFICLEHMAKGSLKDVIQTKRREARRHAKAAARDAAAFASPEKLRKRLAKAQAQAASAERAHARALGRVARALAVDAQAQEAAVECEEAGDAPDEDELAATRALVAGAERHAGAARAAADAAASDAADVARRLERAEVGAIAKTPVAIGDSPLGVSANAEPPPQPEKPNASAAVWPWSERVQLLLDVAEGMREMHDKSFVHRDLKSDNVLVDEQMRAKIADLGLSTQKHGLDISGGAASKQKLVLADDSDREADMITWTARGGTPQYMAPATIAEWIRTGGGGGGGGGKEGGEGDSGGFRSSKWMSATLVSSQQEPEDDEKDEPDNTAASAVTIHTKRKLNTFHAPDAYAFAIIMWELLTLQRPWKGMTIEEIWDAVQKGGRPEVSPEEKRGAPPEYELLMQACWSHDGATRPTFSNVVADLEKIMELL